MRHGTPSPAPALGRLCAAAFGVWLGAVAPGFMVGGAKAAPHRTANAGRPHPTAPSPPPSGAVRTATANSVAARAQAERAATLRDQARKAAEAATSRALALSQQTVQAASRVQRTEQAADDAADRTTALEKERAAAAERLAADSRALAPFLPVIERLSLFPSETLLAAPFAPSDSLTGLSVLRSMGRTLERKAEETRAEAQRLQALETSLGAERDRLVALQRDQAAQQQALKRSADAARGIQAAQARRADQAARDAAAAAARAATLDGVVAQIEAAEKAAQRAAQEAAAKAARMAARPAARGKSPTDRNDADKDATAAARLALPAGPGLAGAQAGAPVAGRLVQRFGDSTDAGAATGVRYAPPPQATVTAPCGGRIDFAGPFRSYGQMLILDCGRQDRFVLAGLGIIDVDIGQSVARGAQLGRMPAWTNNNARPSLYVQLRHGDRTVDPLRVLPH